VEQDRRPLHLVSSCGKRSRIRSSNRSLVTIVGSKTCRKLHLLTTRVGLSSLKKQRNLNMDRKKRRHKRREQQRMEPSNQQNQSQQDSSQPKESEEVSEQEGQAMSASLQKTAYQWREKLRDQSLQNQIKLGLFKISPLVQELL